MEIIPDKEYNIRVTMTQKSDDGRFYFNILTSEEDKIPLDMITGILVGGINLVIACSGTPDEQFQKMKQITDNISRECMSSRGFTDAKKFVD